MAIKYGFFNSVDGDRPYNAEDVGRYLHGLVSSGVYHDHSSSLQVFADSGLTVTVQPGRAMLDCHYMENDSILPLTLDAGEALPRWDLIVMRLDMVSRRCEIAVKKGTAAVAPTIPELLRTDLVKEYALAGVAVRATSTVITQSVITDLRSNSEVCGWVTGLIDQVDTTTLYVQMEAAMQEKLAVFDEWMSVLTNPVPFQESADNPGCLCRIQDGETEWLNPPMVPGAEYRTTERFNGLPVYEVAVSVAELGGVFAAALPVSVPDGYRLSTLSITGFGWYYGTSGEVWTDLRDYCSFRIARWGQGQYRLSVGYGEDFTFYDASFVIKYCKTPVTGVG